MKINSIRNKKNVSGLTVLVRLDLNVPFSGQKIIDDYKIISSLPTLQYLRSKNAKIIIVSHRGEPNISDTVSKWTLKPVADYISKALKTKVLLSSLNWSDIEKKAKALQPKQMLLLENIRLFKGEITNDTNFAKKLASLADIFVNDAFAVSHRNHASVAGILQFLPSFAGLLLEKELINLEKARTGKKPLVLVMGGAKISSKLPLLKNIGKRAETILTGGGIANTILNCEGYEIGTSLAEIINPRTFKELPMSKIIVPLDVLVLNKGKKMTRKVTELHKNDSILDIGPKTMLSYGQIIKDAKTIIWNGPMGKIEDERFKQGTSTIAKAISEATKKGACSVVGGGETVAALATSKKQFSWVSTGGGACLAYLSGEKLPGLTKIIS